MELSKEYTFELVEKKSRFIAVLTPLKNSDELKAKLLLLRKEHPKARHIVHAAVFGSDKSQFSMSDDKEPKYTAGKPILNVLLGSEFTNAGIFVIRYFGGTLLGRGGLTHAYSDSAKGVIKIATASE